jgi:dTDP-4-amino-4,6-dideoxygalactose transaminase
MQGWRRYRQDPWICVNRKRPVNSPIYVTRPSLAPLEEYIQYLETIWETGIVTNNGPMVQQLERELCTYLRVKHTVCVANGTCALQLAIRALDLSGEVITTPFTFVATASIIAWERCRPVFVDITPDIWNIDPDKIEDRITDETSAILPVHVFSAPCDVDRIQAIADKHELRVIYDAAHAITVELGGKPLLRYGDISAVSFHATKLFNTGEGGACDKDTVDSGTNAKMTEISAALGLANLGWLDCVRQNRRKKHMFYQSLLSKLPFVTFQRHDSDAYNYSYMPILFESEELLLRVVDRLADDNIFPRRYFYPSLNTVSVFDPQASLPVSERVGRTVLCLPLYDTLSFEDIERICRHVAAV